MRCDELMKHNVECISQQDSAQHAGERMRSLNIGFLPVVDLDGRVLGTVTDRDLAVRIVADNLPATAPITRCMNREVVACHPEDNIQRAESLMADRQKSRIMVIDRNDKIVGVISLSDIAMVESDGRLGSAIRSVSQREVRT